MSKLMDKASELFSKKYKKESEAIERLDNEMQKYSDKELQHKTIEFKERLNDGETLDDLMVEAFAVCRESCYRILGMKPFFVQLMGAVLLHKGEIAEMKTGEGKTLVATMPTYLNALSGKGVHVVTVNSYLTERDYLLNKPLYDFLGVTSGYITETTPDDIKKECYQKDITYIVNSQLGFDYLNDNRAMHKRETFQRGLNYAIIDEVDSILLDEARTPLILSRAVREESNMVLMVNVLISHLKPDDYNVELKDIAVYLTEKGITKIENFFGLENLMDPDNAELVYTIRQSLLAHYYYSKDKHYLVSDNEIKLIDENTGRVTKGRRYSGGLHQALEAKEGVKVKQENETMASITYQYFFRYYDKIAGMTGTAITEKEELMDVYNLDVVAVPTNKPIQRIDKPDLVYATKELKLKGVLKDIIKTHEQKQPILIGVSTIEQSEEIHALLSKEGIKHTVLNAKNHLKEAEIISQAGQLGAVTVATNMAGRGTDIKLGAGVVEVGGMKIIGTERNMNRRVDNQLRGRAGRQGDVGESQFHVSLEDELLKVFGTDSMKNIVEIMGAALGNEDGVVQNTHISGFIERSQSLLEGNHYDTRKQTIQYDAIINDQRTLTYEERAKVLHEEVSLTDIIKGFAEKHIDSHLKFTLDDCLDKEDSSQFIADKLTEIFHLNTQTKLSIFESCGNTIENLKYRNTSEALIKRVKIILLQHVESRLNILEKDNEGTGERMREEFLSIIDRNWMNHLENIDDIRESIHLVSYAGENPFDAYLIMTDAKFKEMNETIQRELLSVICAMEQ